MLDVHPPEHGIHGAREFGVHLLTITAGLLIAVALENSVEALHHRHQREHAEEMIRQEITQNRNALKAEVPAVYQDYKDLHAVLAFVQARSQDQKADPPKVSLVFHENNIPDSAWRTASTTGALSYMKYEDVQKFSDAYKEQDLLQRTAEETLDDYLQLEPILHNGHDIETLSKQDAVDALPLVRHVTSHLAGMLAVGSGTIQSYNEALK